MCEYKSLHVIIALKIVSANIHIERVDAILSLLLNHHYDRFVPHKGTRQVSVLPLFRNATPHLLRNIPTDPNACTHKHTRVIERRAFE